MFKGKEGQGQNAVLDPPRGGGRELKWQDVCSETNSGREPLTLSDGVYLLWMLCGRFCGGSLLRLGLSWWPHSVVSEESSLGHFRGVRRSQPPGWARRGVEKGVPSGLNSLTNISLYLEAFLT